MKRQSLVSTLFILLISGCGRSAPALTIDLKQWTEDRNGCLGLRSKMITVMDREKEKLLGLTEQQIITLLSRPDQNELYKRNQKFYYYYLEPSQQCVAATAGHAMQLVIRFNAMGVAKEVSIE